MRLFLLIPVFLCHLTIAQTWCPPEARWGYDMGHPWGYASVMQVSCGGDTIVDGHQATKMLGTTVTTQLMGNDTLITGSGLFRITREDQGVVFQWDPIQTAWDTLFWFSAVPGDHWIPPLNWGPCDPPLELHVLDTSTVVMNGLLLRQLEVQPFYDGQEYWEPFHIRERIGYVDHYFNLIMGCEGVFECYCAFTCYADNEIGYPSGPCLLSVGIQDATPASSVQLFPNPGKDHLQIRRDDNVLVRVLIRDIQGRLVQDPISFRETTRIDTQGLPSGTYLIESQTPSTIHIQRWLKE